MRAAQGAAHESGGRHISGTERLISRDQILEVTQDMIKRAFSHSRGQADFINVTVEAVALQSVYRAPLLTVSTIDVEDAAAGRAAAQAALLAAGVTAVAVFKGMQQLVALDDSMRGAMVVCSETGKRLDDTGMRGIRVSRMDIGNEAAFHAWLKRQGLNNVHVREALVLATKVASAPGMLAELCWSDDPEYTAGYVAAAQRYIRFTQLKPYGSTHGGRLFFVRPDSDLAVLCTYLERQAVLVQVPSEEVE
jgi:6-carboxyhexanoate--CoA ligase